MIVITDRLAAIHTRSRSTGFGNMERPSWGMDGSTTSTTNMIGDGYSAPCTTVSWLENAPLLRSVYRASRRARMRLDSLHGAANYSISWYNSPLGAEYRWVVVADTGIGLDPHGRLGQCPIHTVLGIGGPYIDNHVSRPGVATGSQQSITTADPDTEDRMW